MKSMGSAALSLALLVTASQSASASPSFDCREYRHPSAERAICRSGYLSRLDRRLANAYDGTLGQLGDTARDRFQTIQRNWLRERNGCGEQRWCISASYRKRLAQIRQIERCLDDASGQGCVWRMLRWHEASLH